MFTQQILDRFHRLGADEHCGDEPEGGDPDVFVPRNRPYAGQIRLDALGRFAGQEPLRWTVWHGVRGDVAMREHIENSYELEKQGVATYNEAVALAIEKKDAGSRDLMERMVVESEESIDWAESQFDLIKLVGLEQYLAQQMNAGA